MQIKSALPYGQGKAAGGAAHQVVEVFDEKGEAVRGDRIEVPPTMPTHKEAS